MFNRRSVNSIRLCILSLYRVICATLLRGAITTF
nr:MAG TPA: hypothetical protein [Caudoviricetes sp.]